MRTTLLIIFLALAACVAGASFFGCDSGYAGGGCQCSGDTECATDFHCNGCQCLPDCTGPADCPATAPNCGPDGRCFGPCSSGADCPPDWPNCDTDTGICLEPCNGDEDCPPSAFKCDPTTGLCFDPECVDDTECDPPTTVCESFVCVPGCETHADCDPAERCDLITPEHLYHCEPRDCSVDADCALPTVVCDTDGLAQADGGGYCLPGCQTVYDCPVGYDCDPAAGTCSLHNYGDIGQDCALGCSSNFCLVGMGNQCTAFCCRQVDCPPGWGCQTYDDGTGLNYTVDVCVPLPSTQGAGRLGDACTQAEECRSNICWANQCRETCCSHADCQVPGGPSQSCIHNGGVTMCMDTPTTGDDPLGTLGCSTTGSPGGCLSNLCFSYISNDTACTTNNDCPATRPTCHDYNTDGITDCVKDICLDQCCSEADCSGFGGDQFFCGKITFGVGDYNVCLLYPSGGTGQPGDACTNSSDCRSNFCSTSGLCRQRCCVNADCPPSAPNCQLELHSIYGANRWVNVCLL